MNRTIQSLDAAIAMIDDRANSIKTGWRTYASAGVKPDVYTVRALVRHRRMAYDLRRVRRQLVMDEQIDEFLSTLIFPNND